MSAPHRPEPADDTERDAWLSEALRHAPDARAAAPAALSESILRQARAATRGAASPAAPRGALAAAWAWLLRPPVAAGFASLLVAATVGMMWWDRPMDETLSPPPAAAPERRPAPAPVTPSATEPVAPQTAPQTAPQAAPATVPPAANTRAAPREKPAARAPQANRAESKAAPADELRDEARQADSTTLPRSASKHAAPAAALTAQRPTGRELRPPALAALIDAVATRPERWSWQRGGAKQPMNPALQRWLVQLDDAAVSHWRTTNTTTTDPAVLVAASVLRLYRDGTLTATLRLTDDAVWLAPASQATLPAASIASLKRALDDAAP